MNPVAATDADNDALTYTLGGPDAASFDIDETIGQLKTDADLDYEKKNAYTVTVTVSRWQPHGITITVIIIIIDLGRSRKSNAHVNFATPNRNKR